MEEPAPRSPFRKALAKFRGLMPSLPQLSGNGTSETHGMVRQDVEQSRKDDTTVGLDTVEIKQEESEDTRISGE